MVELPSWPQPEIANTVEVPAPKKHKKLERRDVVKPLVQNDKNEVIESLRAGNSSQAIPLSGSAEIASPTPTSPPPALFKPIGYVEKQDGQMEAIVLQENEVQVVHLGDEIAGRYRVTKITPDLVSTVDETQILGPLPGSRGGRLNDNLTIPQVLAANWEPGSSSKQVSPLAAHLDVDPKRIQQAIRISNPDSILHDFTLDGTQQPGNSLGYVEKANGKVEEVIADGDSVRLITSTPSMAQNQMPEVQTVVPTSERVGSFSAVATTVIPDLEKSLFRRLDPAGVLDSADKVAVDSARGEIDGSNMSSDDRSAGRKVSPQRVAAPSPVEQTSPTDRTGAPVEASRRNFNDYRESLATYIFQTLGFVQSQSGEVKAIVAEGSDTYLVKRGQVFADQYRATSVDPFIVLAVKVSPPKQLPGFVLPETDFALKVASNHLQKQLHSGTFSLGLMTIGGSGQEFRSALSPTPGISLFNMLPTRSDDELYFSPKP